MTTLHGVADAAALRRSVGAEAGRGDPASQLALAQMLLDGIGGQRDPEQAYRWFRKAAEAGVPLAMTMLGRCHEKGWGTPISLSRAAFCYRRAAARGDDWACYNLANMLLRGRGVPADRGAAWDLFLVAARNGHAKSMNLVGRFLDEGWSGQGLPETAPARERGRAAEVWYRRSAEAGDYRGRHNLACMLAETGRLAEALAWWSRALDEATPDILVAMQTALSQIGCGPDRSRRGWFDEGLSAEAGRLRDAVKRRLVSGRSAFGSA